jgi:preprotein translocase subunit SecA
MIKNLMTAVFGTRFDRERRRIQPVLDAIHAEEARLGELSEAELKDQTAKFRARLADQTSALKTELDEVRAAKHACADPEERGRLEQRAHELEVGYRKALAETLMTPYLTWESMPVKRKVAAAPFWRE